MAINSHSAEIGIQRRRPSTSQPYTAGLHMQASSTNVNYCTWLQGGSPCKGALASHTCPHKVDRQKAASWPPLLKQVHAACDQHMTDTQHRPTLRRPQRRHCRLTHWDAAPKGTTVAATHLDPVLTQQVNQACRQQEAEQITLTVAAGCTSQCRQAAMGAKRICRRVAFADTGTHKHADRATAWCSTGAVAC